MHLKKSDVYKRRKEKKTLQNVFLWIVMDLAQLMSVLCMSQNGLEMILAQKRNTFMEILLFSVALWRRICFCKHTKQERLHLKLEKLNGLDS